jgi:hypothetical protein
MMNRELYFRDPTTLELLNNGVSKVSEIGHDERQIKTLRFELETFVCDGEYARGLERILKAYRKNELVIGHIQSPRLFLCHTTGKNEHRCE